MEEVNCVLGEDEHDGIVDVDTPEAVPDRPAQRLEGRQIQSLLARIESVRFEQLCRSGKLVQKGDRGKHIRFVKSLYHLFLCVCGSICR